MLARMFPSRIAVAPLLFVALVVACSGSTTSSSATPDQACNDAAQTLCNKISTCVPYILKVAYGDVATCVTRSKVNCVSGFSASGTSATPSSVETCVNDANAVSCDDLLARNGPSSCFTQPGQLADGAACGTDAQCKGTLCRMPADNSCGACSSPGVAGTCRARDADCDHGLVCTSSKCVAPGAAGAACNADTPCLASLACVSGKCVTALGAGVACTFVLNENPCSIVQGLFCNPKSKVCAQIGYADAGGQCGYFNDNFVACTGSATCKGANLLTQTPGTCEAPATDGATCDTLQGGSCMPPARCISGLCKITDPTTCK
jgi:hypothetical protein